MNDVAPIDMSVGLLRWNALVAFAGAAAEQLLLGRHTERAALDFHFEVETNDNVRMWLKGHREQLERSVEREVERELRESEH